MGYWLAGFDVIGCDVEHQPLYPFKFIQGDWREALSFLLDRRSVALVHASPPCQRYMTGGRTNRSNAPDLIGPVRKVLHQLELDYVIENVPESPLRDPITLCGSMFGLKVRRHRLFEVSWSIERPSKCTAQAHASQRPIVGVYGHPHGERGAWPGMQPSTLETWREAMGMPWASARGISQAIPPAYTRWIGERSPVMRDLKLMQSPNESKTTVR
jgi:DNA (cytosine-5)-methyltransferase 1